MVWAGGKSSQQEKRPASGNGCERPNKMKTWVLSGEEAGGQNMCLKISSTVGRQTNPQDESS